MTQALDIQISNFREALKFAQHSLFSGFLVAGLVLYLDLGGGGKAIPGVPFVNITFDSVDTLVVALGLLYFGTGFATRFGMRSAHRTLLKIDQPDVVAALAMTPCILVAGHISQAIVWGAVGGAGYLLALELIAPGEIKGFFIGLLLSSPYFSAIGYGRMIHKLVN